MPRHRRARTRIPALALAALLALSMVAGCREDRRRPCGEAYDHLVEIAKRRPNAKLRAEFVEACTQAFDPDRHRCLLAATSPAEALECRPKRYTTE